MKAKKIIVIVVLILVIVGLVEVYFSYADQHPATNDARVTGNYIRVVPAVAGKVIVSNVKDNQHVIKGQLLFQIEDKTYRLKLREAQAKLNVMKAKQAAANEKIAADRFKLKKAKAELDLLQEQTAKTMNLVNEKVIPSSKGDVAQTNLKSMQNSYDALEKEFQELNIMYQSYTDEIVIAETQVALAEDQLNHTKYYAPIDGFVTQTGFHIGDEVAVGDPLFVLIDPHSYKIVANFYESDVKTISRGQHAQIKLKMYPDMNFNGVVETVGVSSLSSFALLPVQNASGNWIDTERRFPVVIRFNNSAELTEHPVRMGASGKVVITDE